MKPVTIDTFASSLSKLLHSDRYVLLVADGETGEGKSCFTTQMCRATAKLTKTSFSFQDNLTFSRKELIEWVDGKNQKPEKSVIIADELISMFFKRNWYDKDQIGGIELLNKCRDRHLLISGNIPNFWDLDKGIHSLVTFWVNIYERGRAFVFQKSRNMFTTDKWQQNKNEKIFYKYRNPYKSPNFVCEVIFNDWNSTEKKEYYQVRNKKRVGTESQVRDSYRYIRNQRDILIRFIKDISPETTNDKIAELLVVHPSLIAQIIQGGSDYKRVTDLYNFQSL